MTGPTQDIHAWWRKALANPKLIGTKELPVHENDPQPGRYRVKNKDGSFDPVAIWYEGQAVAAMRNGKHCDPFEVWTRACKRPVKSAVYEMVMRGGSWPDGIDDFVDEERVAEQQAKVAAAVTAEPERNETIQEIVAAAEKHFGTGVEVVEEPAAGIGHNSGEPHEVALDELKSLERRIAAWVGKIETVDNEEKDAQGQEFQRLVREQVKAIEDGFRAEKDPAVKAAKAIDDKWRDVRERGTKVVDRLSALLTPYRVERDRKRREEEQARRKAASEVGEAPATPAPARAEPKGYRTVTVCVVTDPVAAATDILTQVPDHPDMIDAIRKVAARMIKAGVSVKGVQMKEEHRA